MLGPGQVRCDLGEVPFIVRGEQRVTLADALELVDELAGSLAQRLDDKPARSLLLGDLTHRTGSLPREGGQGAPQRA
ncbi:MAG TPA: hypothetical protein VFA70_13705, partial [Dehalococcoidia bacterium]|nr:hypothetical protein [Dehalococcoidia bacterium]